MNSVLWLLVASIIYATYAAPSLPPLPVNPGGIGGLFRGPNSETIIRGPDGSEITSEQLGGAVHTEAKLQPIVVPDQITISSVFPADAQGIDVSSANHLVAISDRLEAPVPEAPITFSVPAVEGPTADREPHIIETELVDAPEIEPNQSSDLNGPSGSISVRGSTSIVSGPASTTISEPVRKIPIASIPVLASAPAISSFPSEVLIPPHPSAVDSYSTAQASLNSNENSPQQSFSNYPSQSYYNPQQPQSYPSPVLIPPPPPHSQTVWNESPQLSYAQIPQIRTVSSSKIPKESLPPNTLDLGQTIVSTTQRTNSAPSQSDVDVSRINLQISSNSGLIPQLSSNIQTSLDEDSRQSLPDYPLNAPSTQTVSSAQNPEESLPPNIINLGQTVVSTTQRTDSVPSHRGVEVARINLQNPSLYTHSRVIPQLSPNIQTSFDGDSRQSLAVHPLDAPSTQTQITISSPSNNLNLKQAVVPTTQSTNSVPSGSDLEVTNINDYQQLPQLSPNIQTSFSENSRIHSGNTAQQTFSSTPIPKESLPPNTIDLGQTVVTTTRITDGAASTGDIDVRRINLGQSYTHQNFAQSSVISQLSSSTIPPLGERNIVSSTSAPILSSSIQTSYLAEQTGIPSSSPNRQLFRKASDIGENSLSSISSSSNLIFTLNGLTGRVPSPDQSIITNQISSNSPLSSTEDIRNRISSTEAPRNNIASSPWINVDPDHILPSAVTQPLNGGNHGPISTILDTVLVQPTDPKNREVIEFGGKQLENVGNIVPVIRHPVLVAGGLSHIQHIPTASISQLTARNGLRGPYDRNGGQLSDGN